MIFNKNHVGVFHTSVAEGFPIHTTLINIGGTEHIVKGLSL